MKYYKLFFLISINTIILQSSFALDFKTLQKYTIENSKLLQISKLDIDISKTQLDYINSEKYPTISIGVSAERSKGLNDDSTDSSYVGDNSVSSSSLYKTYSYLSLNYSLFDFGRLYYKTKSQNFDIETKKNDYCIEQNKISQKLLDLYFNVRITEIKKQYLDEILKYSNNLYQYYKRLHEIGNIQKTEVVTNAIAVANLYNDISNNNKTYIENLEKLSNLSNFDLKTTNKLDSLSISKEIMNKRFEDTNLAKKYLNEIQNKQAELDLIQAQYYPQINLFGKYDFYGYDQDSFSSSIDNFEENSYKYGLNITWQIFDGFKKQAQEKKASHELAQLNLKYEQAKIDFLTELNILNKTYRFYSKIMEKNAKALNLSDEKVDIALRLNSIGEIDKSIEINSIIKKLYTESEYKQAQETIAYKMMKKDIMLNGDNECIVH
jgi:outer membrane protein TolC